MGDFFDDKRILVLGGICAAAGVAIGLLLAPLTHGITITLWSNNALGSGKNLSHSTTGGSSRHRLVLNKNNSASAHASANAGKKKKKHRDCCSKKF
ncbi:MAG: hypothetical protein QM697_05575 [Lachnospiraceae bacterium]